MTETARAKPSNGNMKLVYVLNQFSRNESSHFVHVIGLVEALAAIGVDVLLVIEKAFNTPEIAAAGVRVVGLMERSAFRRFFKLALTIRAAARDGYGAVFVRIGIPAALTAVIACLGTGARVYYWQSGTVHALDRATATGSRRLIWLVRNWLPFRLVVWAVDGFATGPETMIRYYRDVVRVPERKLVCLYNDIDVRQFRDRMGTEDRIAVRASLGATAATKVLLFVHRLSPIRRTMMYVPPLLDALRGRAQAQWHMVFAGGGPELEDLVKAVSQPGLFNRCSVLGELPARELIGLYLAADVFVNPSYVEGFPRVILEAMAAGLPIVTTDAGGTADILGPLQQHFVIPRDDPARFATSVSILMDDSALQRALAEENCRAVHRFDTGTVAEMYRKELFG
jgi:glycosyltransferase involved in cell wall biosynthesis